MKKLVIKTVALSLAIILAVLALVVLLVSSLSPITVANAYFRLGNTEMAVKYTEKNYIKTQSLTDLALLVERGILAEDNEIVVKYSPNLLFDSKFEELAQQKSGDYTNYIVNGYVVSLYNVSDIEKSIAIAFQYVDANFTLPNPVTTLIYKASSKNDVTTLNKVLAVLETLPQNDNIETVINAVKSFI